MIVSSPAISHPALVASLEAHYLASVRSNFQNSPYLLNAGRERLASLLQRNATAAEIGDAHFLGLAEHYVAEHGVSLRPLEAGSVLTPLGPVPQRALDWVKKVNPVRSLQGADAAMVLDRFRNDPSAHVFGVEGCRATMPWDIGGAPFLYLSQCGLHLYHSEENGNFKGRLVGLRFWEALLNLCFGEAGARLCLASGEVPKKEYNELHRLNYHPVGLSFEEEYLEDAYVHPFLFATHDAFFHALNWTLQVAPWRRSASAVFYKVLGETEPDMARDVYADCLEWSLDPEVDNREAVMESIVSTLGIFQHAWNRRGEAHRAPQFFRSFLSYLPEIESRRGEAAPEFDAFKSSLMALAAA